VAFLAAVLLVVAAPGSAGAQTTSQAPCWKRLLLDSYDGTVNKLYPIPCYHQAIAHLSPSALIYSDFKDEILAAEQAAENGRTVASVSGAPTTTTTAAAGSSHGSSSLPLPLLVLGGLALVMLAAGGIGLLWQRRRPGGPASS
jgi:hypothetical protein